MISTICWLIAIAALCNAARLKYNEVRQAKKMREEKGLSYDNLY